MLTGTLNDSEITVVRDLLDNLAWLRSRTGLAQMEERRYRELCVMELSLLSPH
jgi:hypothetical protein